MKRLIGTKLNYDVYSDKDILLLRKGTIVSEKHVAQLAKYEVHIAREEASSQENGPYDEALQALKKAYRALYGKTKLSAEDVQQMEQAVALLAAIQNLTPVSLKEKIAGDDDLYQHSVNVGLLAKNIGALLGLGSAEQHVLLQMGIYHDIGKFQLDDYLLRKSASLSRQEQETVKKHPEFGFNLLQSAGLPHEVLLGAYMHHERLDGSGYPRGIKEQVPYLVRILTVANRFDKICSRDHQKKRVSFFVAVEGLMNEVSAGGLDRSIVVPFCEAVMKELMKRPITLLNGKKAQIVHVYNEYPHQPLLQVEGHLPLNLHQKGLTIQQVAVIE
ncbi:metal dependent phosphohydrolase [Fictibacillus macauensis ZFHKF-1]|uniref:Metal dependent phosphohydrolase n=1 Tax=Fictibacillus macauensis ZFHKF-1 TaxID=1196324 RepID=I8UH94_9BACL|nr:HD domain-containing phosphohydrolase [Fictibacillus macauensis]EIT86280.1 metal dependent phosphohydrolase [Fictibacillus macauensis ZFHKF-1]